LANKNKDLKLVKVGTVRKYMDAHFRDEISYSEAVNRINKEANKNMKAKLTFDLPDYQEEFEMAVYGHKWRNVTFMMFNFLRNNTKYAPEGTHEEYLKAMYECKDELFRIMQDNGVDLEV
jgi:hypothetical protein